MPRPRTNQNVLDLHDFRASSWEFFETELFYKLDEFIFSRSKTAAGSRLEIIVGKGLRSKRFIGGKNPLRHYTEQYLNQAGLSWTSGSFVGGGEGVIFVYL